MAREAAVGGWSRIIIAGCIIIVAMAGAPASVHGQPAPPNPGGERPANAPPTLTVTGDGESSSRPDRAVVELGAVAQAGQAAAAQDEVNVIMQAAIEAIRGVGIDEQKISTAGISLHPVYTDRQPVPLKQQAPPQPRIVGYRAGNRVRVVIDDLTKLGAVIDAGVKAGANEVQGINFQLKDATAARGEALTDAAKKARAKADALASALDLRIDRVLAVYEGGVNVFEPRMELGRANFAAMEASTPVQPGEVDVQASVTITYRVSPEAADGEK